MQELQVPEKILRVLRTRRSLLIKGLSLSLSLPCPSNVSLFSLSILFLARQYMCTHTHTHAQCECRDCQNNKPAASEGEGAAGAATATLTNTKKRKFVPEDPSSSLANGVWCMSFLSSSLLHSPPPLLTMCLCVYVYALARGNAAWRLQHKHTLTH